VQKLAPGIHRFRSQYFAKNKKLFERLAADGQRPETLFITCSDSRVVPNLITSSSPGDLFIVRNIGNIVPAVERQVMGGVAAAIQYAVEFLRVEDVIVCGHTGCGAIDAILHPERAQHLTFVSRWLREAARIPEIVAERYADLDPEQRLIAAVEENVLFQLENLRTYDFVAKRLDEGKLSLSGWVYKISSGQIFDYDPDSEQFMLLAADGEPTRPLSTRPPAPA
jgi:carbonic anhydrase